MRSVIFIFSIFLFISSILPNLAAQNAKTITPDLISPFEKNNNSTATYHEAIDFYKKLDLQFPQLTLKEYGSTDSGFPIHLAVLSTNGDFDANSIRKSGKQVLNDQ